MKKWVLIMLLMVVLSVAGQAKTGQTIVSIEPFSLFEGSLNLQYEGVVNPETTWTIRGSAFEAGGALLLGARHYMDDSAPRKLWIGGFIGPASSHGAFALIAAGDVGYKWIMNDSLVIEPHGGIGYVSLNIPAYGNVSGLVAFLGLNLGYAF